MSHPFSNVTFSVLDLAPVLEGHEPGLSFQNSADLAQYVESLGYHRYWLAEHHNMPGIASSATSLIISHIASHTSKIRVGSGGIMLPNHAPLVIAEQFGTLDALYPDRIDLGLGRAPGSDQATAYALRRTLNSSADDFPNQVEELEAYFAGEARVKAVPGMGANVPLWLLGSSDFSARLAAEKGLPFAFASHFSPDYTIPALRLYRDRFKPSNQLSKPNAMVGVNIIAAETEEKAKWLATSQQQQFLSLVRGAPSKLMPPIDNIDDEWSIYEKASVEKSVNSKSTIIGDKDQVREKLATFIEETETDEVIINSQIYDHEARKNSYQIVADIFNEK
ncbi:LLM class flavin-dependent oxidoreductase [Gracilibacillus caseinilyticus]|uniref:LLM class flavin-dependent oxidoreductase n=1 Tax=Gracilibacillus caseinilyticus TaxID=2932256 RepID=A0ABY4ESC5_9BACI|nr:LLM class flavin-dependent oxidoreductase [Gracilibacillus caseinilyticus]UOQ47083.1 LLM class flavin-dependent oxidoreductase [Gracilibacillus caseinilyticus]